MTTVDTRTAAAALGVTPATIRQWVARGKLHPAGRRGRSNTYRLADLAALIDPPKPAVSHLAADGSSPP